jgi:rSAM/selenodomain-associated transferase 1
MTPVERSPRWPFTVVAFSGNAVAVNLSRPSADLFLHDVDPGREGVVQCLPVQVLVMAKAPIAGRVKTRLCPPFSAQQAADLAEAALLDTLDTVAAAAVRRRLLVFDGDPAGWARPGLAILPQRGGGLDERLAAALDDAYRDDACPMLLVGMDTPQLTPGVLTAAAATLLSEGVDAVLGPAADGGWWLLGLRRADPRLLLGVPMSTSRTGRFQGERLRAAGLAVAVLPTYTDVDTADDAARVAATIPGSRFAACLARTSAASR